MTASVSRQTAYVALTMDGAQISRQTAYVAMTVPGVSVSRQTVYVALLKDDARRRAMFVT
jgi:hypothetical protein